MDREDVFFLDEVKKITIYKMPKDRGGGVSP